MKPKILFCLFAIVLFVSVALAKSPSLTHAQQATETDSGKIPSDLFLDLALAEQNPAPEQQQILSSQTTQVEVTTAAGDNSFGIPQNTLPEVLKTESIDDAIHPEQTTSEQVMSIPVTVEDNGASPTQDQNQQGQNSQDTNTNTVPGTTIQEPDDNSAPTQPPASNGTNTIPLENGSTQNTTPQDTNQPSNPSNSSASTGQSSSIPQDNTNTGSTQPSQDSSTNNSDSTTTNTDTTNDTDSVQGITTGPKIPWWKKILNSVVRLF